MARVSVKSEMVWHHQERSVRMEAVRVRVGAPNFTMLAVLLFILRFCNGWAVPNVAIVQ